MAAIASPIRFSQAIADEIIQRLMEGESLREICQSQHMPTEGAVRAWAVNDALFGAQYMRARDIGLDCQLDRMLAVAADDSRDPKSRAVEIDALKWRLCKMAPKRYGDRIEIAGDAANPLTLAVEYVHRAQVDRAPDGIIDARPARAIDAPKSEE